MKKYANFLDFYRNFKICKNKRIWYSIPMLFIVAALIVIITIGATSGSYTDAIGIGIDFEGGTLITVTLGSDAIDNYDENAKLVEEKIESYGVVVSYVQKQEASNVDNSSISFRYKNKNGASDAEILALNEEIINAVDNLYPERPGNVTYESISPTAAQDLLSKAGIALAVSVALILVYIIIRFTVASGLAAIIALIHDVVIMFCLTVICRVQINTSFVAAMITIIAYSINNTIIIFDRCRENVKPLKGQRNIPYEEIGDNSVHENMRRSIFTTLTTMITIIFLAILGSDSIREFCVPILLGLCAGLYSSVFVATPLWCDMSRAFDKLKIKYTEKNAVVYDTKDDEDETVFKGEARKEADYEEGEEQVPAVKKEEKKKANAVYKYSKKNTTFKKKK